MRLLSLTDAVPPPAGAPVVGADDPVGVTGESATEPEETRKSLRPSRWPMR